MREVVTRIIDGRPFDVSFPEYPSTGYRWRLLAWPDSSVLMLTQTAFTPYLHEGSEMKVGAGGTRTFSFRPMVPEGFAAVTFALSRPWDQENLPDIKAMVFQIVP